jgi:hypothetical protein
MSYIHRNIHMPTDLLMAFSKHIGLSWSGIEIDGAICDCPHQPRQAMNPAGRHFLRQTLPHPARTARKSVTERLPPIRDELRKAALPGSANARACQSAPPPDPPHGPQIRLLQCRLRQQRRAAQFPSARNAGLHDNHRSCNLDN